MPVAAPERTPSLDGRAPSDADLVALALAGSGDAYAAIYERHRTTVTSVVRARLGCQGDPADAVQDAFTAAWRNLATLREPSQLRPWLHQIARRTAIDHGRRYRRQPLTVGDEALEPVADIAAGPEEVAEAHDAAHRIDDALARLSRRDATVISLAVHLGFGPDEIAAAMGVTPGNAKVILHRARRRLRVALTAA